MTNEEAKDTEQLKPCPFCGGEAEYIKVGNTHMGVKEATIKCKLCKMQYRQKFSKKRFDFEWIDDVMIGAWNRRVADDE